MTDVNVTITEENLDVSIVEEDINVTVTEAESIDVTITGGEGVSSHPLLSNLDWIAGEHIGTADKIAGFDANGDATYYNEGKVRISEDDTTPAYLEDKITSDDSSVIISTTSPTGDENLDLSVTLESARQAGNVLAGDVDFDNNNIDNVGYIDFDINAMPTHQEGRVHYSPAEETLEVGLPNGVVGQIFEEDFTAGQNDTGDTLADGTVATYAGSIGNSGNFRIEHTVASASEHPLSTIGIITADITDGDTGKITTRGKVRGIQTDGANYSETWLEGTPVYKSSTVAGGLTNVPPQAPIPAIPLAVVISAHPTNGTLFVRPTFPTSLEMLTNVDGADPTLLGDLMTYNAVSAVWDRGIYNINNYIPKTQNDLTKDPTGFTEPEDVIVTGDDSTRTVTLTGTVNAYFRGELNETIINGWTSPAHSATTTTSYFLYYDGIVIEWVDVASLPEDFYVNTLIAIAFYDSVNATWVYNRECHGLQPWQCHRQDHRLEGTYRQSGGGLDDYVLDSTTAADRRPSIEATQIFDEDLPTTSPLLPTGTYTTTQLVTSGIVNFLRSQGDIVPLSGNQPYWNEFDGNDWVQTLMSNNSYMSVWVGAIPTASDANSQELRYIFAQGQSESATLLAQQVLDARTLNIGNLQGLSPEFVFTNQIILRYIGGNWQIVEVRALTGSRASQTSSPAGNYLTTVSSDASLDGLGTVSSPLSVSTDFFNKTTDDTDDITDTADNRFTNDTDITRLANTSGTNTGDQDLSALALKSNVLELDNTDVFSPNADYEPATKKYADDVSSGGGTGGFYKGYINGGTCANDGTTPDEIVNVSAVRTRSSDDTLNLVVAQTDLDITDSADWAAGVSDFLNDIPTMTDNTTPAGYVASASTEQSPNLAYQAFDKDTDNNWVADAVDTGWIKLQIPVAKKYTSYALTCPLGITNMAKDWTLEGSNTGAFAGEETILDTQVGQTWSASERRIYNFSNENSFSYYRIDITANNGNAYLVVNEVEFSISQPITDASIFVWADYNSGTNRVILDDATGSNIAGSKRLCDEFLTDGSGDIIPFTKYGYASEIETCYITPITDRGSSLGTTSAVLQDLSIPVGIGLYANTNVRNVGGSNQYSWITSPCQDDITPTSTYNNIRVSSVADGQCNFLTGTEDATIRLRCTSSAITFYVQTMGYNVKR